MLRQPISLYLPLLLLLIIFAYLSPNLVNKQPSPQSSQSTPNFSLPERLSPSQQQLFAAVRPATVRISGINPSKRQGGEGSGFFINGEGEILTAHHVVNDSKLLIITTLDKKNYPARLLAYDAASDIALLKIDAKNKTYLQLAEKLPRINEQILAIGNSGGDFLQPRQGKLLRLAVNSGRADFPQGALEMNAPLNLGDSGGPIIDQRGKAVGVVSYVRQDQTGITRRSYAIPVFQGSQLVKSLKQGQKNDIGVLGVELDTYHPSKGGLIAKVIKGSPAAKAGLRGHSEGQLGDVITHIAGQRTTNVNEVIEQLRRHKVGDELQIKILRSGKSRQLNIKLVANSRLIN